MAIIQNEQTNKKIRKCNFPNTIHFNRQKRGGILLSKKSTSFKSKAQTDQELGQLHHQETLEHEQSIQESSLNASLDRVEWSFELWKQVQLQLIYAC